VIGPRLLPHLVRAISTHRATATRTTSPTCRRSGSGPPALAPAACTIGH